MILRLYLRDFLDGSIHIQSKMDLEISVFGDPNDVSEIMLEV